MSKTPKGQANHPMIGLITNLVASINNYIKNRMVPEAVSEMINLLAMINPAHQDKDLQTALTGFSQLKRRTIEKHIRFDLSRCRTYRDQIMVILWNNGYWTDEGWGFHDPSNGRKSE